MTLPVFDLATKGGVEQFNQCLQRLRRTTSLSSDQASIVRQVIADVRDHGDKAIERYMRKWTDPAFSANRIRVTPQEISAATDTIDRDLREAIGRSIDHVREYQRHILPSNLDPVSIGGADVGLRFTPVESVGLAVPGGKGVLFSTLIMLAVPAQVAGVDARKIAVINPPPTRRDSDDAADVSPIVLATCAMLNIETVYRIGGAQAVAALAFGTESVEPVEMIAGPGNVYVQLAKSQVSGVVGTDGGFYGPSEIITIADHSADPASIAADLVAQAEHDPGKCFLVSWSGDVIERIMEQIDLQLPRRLRREAIEAALRDDSCAVAVADASQAIEVANTIACEHVNLAVADPDSLLPAIRHAGTIFLGHQTPVAAGDYYAGPSHCLPTGTTARFSSGISVYSFLKRTATVCYRNGMSHQAMNDIARLAEAEALDGHADSVRLRRSGS